MGDKIDFSFQVLHTTIRVIYADITRLEPDADVLVSSDDVHLSMAGGVGAAIRAAAGDGPRDDIRKHALPVPLGSVLVTSAGQLRAKHIFHATTLDFQTRSRPDVLIPQIVRRVIELANVLQVERVAIPLLGTGTAGMQKLLVLDLLVRRVACCLASKPSALRDVAIVIYASRATDHDAAEQKLFEEIVSLHEQIERWAAEAAPFNHRIGLLWPLLAAVGDDGELKQMIESRIYTDQLALSRLFGCGESPEVAAGLQAAETYAGASNSRQEYEGLRKRLSTLLEDLAQEIDHLEELKWAEKRRLRPLERQRAQRGNDTPPEVIVEIEDIRHNLEQREQQIQKIKEQQLTARRDFDALQHRWQHQQSRSER